MIESTTQESDLFNISGEPKCTKAGFLITTFLSRFNVWKLRLCELYSAESYMTFKKESGVVIGRIRFILREIREVDIPRLKYDREVLFPFKAYAITLDDNFKPLSSKKYK